MSKIKFEVTQAQLLAIVNIIEDGYSLDIEGGGDGDLSNDPDLMVRKNNYKLAKRAFNNNGLSILDGSFIK